MALNFFDGSGGTIIMKLAVLMDNNTYIDHYYCGEPGLSFYIENGEDKILFDTGYSDMFLKNAEKMDIDLSLVNKIVFSHGHNDHTNGFKYYNEKFGANNVKVFCCSGCFDPKFAKQGYIGSPLSENEIKGLCKLSFIDEPTEISRNLYFLGKIPEYFDFEKRYSIGVNEKGEKDYILEDSAMVYKTDNGLFIITGCSHSGICNISEHAVKVFGDNRIIGILGGFHLFENDERLKQTIEYFKLRDIKNIYPCHCVSFKAKCAINSEIPVYEVAVGMKIEI